MAIGYMAYGAESKTTGQQLNIRPTTSGEEWIIHNIYVTNGSNCTLYRYVDGTNDIPIASMSYWIGNLDIHCNTTSYVYVKNNGSTTYIAYDGIIVKSS